MAGRGKRGAAQVGVGFKDVVDGFSSGYGVIDYVSGVPGVLFPRATIVEVYGQKSASKTTLILETIAFNQLINPGFRVLYADFEKMLRNQLKYIQSLGVNTDASVFVQLTPNTMEEGCKDIQERIKTERFDMVIVDTIAAMRPAAEIEKGLFESKQIGIKGKLMSEFLRNLMADLPEDGPSIVFINQMYKDLQNSSFVQQYNTPSSDALKFYAGIRIEVRETAKLKDKVVNPYTLEQEEIPFGSIIQISTSKNKMGRPFLKSKYTLTYGKGIDIIPTIAAAALKAGIITTKGNSKSSFVLQTSQGEKSVVGMSRLLKFFYENPEEAARIGSQINELWEHDMQYLVARLARKKSMDVEMYEVADGDEEDGGEGLDLEGDGDSPEGGTIDMNSLPPDPDVATEKDISTAFTGGPAPIVRKAPVQQPPKPLANQEPAPGSLASGFKLRG